MRKFIVAANWKLHKNPEETGEFLRAFLKNDLDGLDCQFLIFPPAINLLATWDYLKASQVGWGPQNVFYETTGAFTGENSVRVAKDIGATHALIGHSERRQIFKETDEDIAKKLKACQEVDLIPVFCLGESLAERDSGETNNLIRRQLREGLQFLDPNKDFVVAYEPVWAIGTGKVATPGQAQEAHEVLRSELKEHFGDEIAKKTSILYGGSVKAANAKILSEQADIDGFLVGGASLQPESFFEIATSSTI